MDLQKHLQELRADGITVIPNAYTKDQCKYYIDRFEVIMDRFITMKKPQDPRCQIIENPFRHDQELFNLIYHPFIESILSVLIDPNYVLINSNVINRRIRPECEGGTGIGMTWHTDSRYLDGKRMDRGVGYICGSMFNDFTAGNAGTKYVPGSHLRREIPEREAPYEFKQMVGEAGSMVIFDTGMWHRGGDAGEKDRWSMFSYYGPWFMKPYYRYPELFAQEFGPNFHETLSKPLRRLFHYNSTPPLSEDENRGTVTP